MLKPELLTLPVVCATFPQLDHNAVIRENLLDTLDTLTLGDVSLISVEGDEGIGKTHLLAQFSQRHPYHTISFFSPPTGNLTLASDLFKFDLCNQLSWLLSGEELRDPGEASERLLRNHLLSLQRMAQRKSEIFFFVVDGLDQALDEDGPAIAQLMDLLPLGLPRLKVLISRPMDKLENRSGLKCKSFVVPLFTFDETKRYFADIPILDPDAKIIHGVCRGMPGHLATIKRILRSGVSCEDLIEQMPERMPALLELEWKRIEPLAGEQAQFLALLCFDSKTRTPQEVSDILSLDVDVINRWVNDIGFIEANPKTNEMSYASSALKRFASRKLSNLERSTHERLLDYIACSPYGDDSLFQITDHLQQLERFDDLISHLTPENTIQMLQRSQSMALLKQNTSIGIKAASTLRQHGNVLRFSLQRSMLESLGSARAWHEEVEARLALKDYDSALYLANSTIAKEHRLHLLVLIAKAKRGEGLTPEDSLIEQIRQIYSQIEPEHLGEQSLDLAADLLAILPDLAIDLLERSKNNVSRADFDSALASVSFAAVSRAAKSAADQPRRLLDTVKREITDSKARSFFTELSVALGDYSAVEIMTEVSKIERVADQLRLLAEWAQQNAQRDDAHSVTEYALNMALQTATFAPTPQWLKQISTPLAHFEDEREALRLVGVIDAQRGSISEAGPTEDLVSLQLALAECEHRFIPNSARNRLVDVFLSVSEIPAQISRLNSLARLYGFLKKIDTLKELERIEGLHSLCESELRSMIPVILSSTADQFEVFKRMLFLLAQADLEIGILLARSLNDDERKNQGMLHLLESLIELPMSPALLADIGSVYTGLLLEESRNHALLQIMQRLADTQNVEAELTSAASPWISRIADVARPEQRCIACCSALIFLAKTQNSGSPNLLPILEKQLQEAWAQIDADWIRASFGFKMTAVLADHRLDVARLYLAKAEEVRRSLTITSDESAGIVTDCVRLAMRTLAGLLPKRLDSKDDLSRLTSLIERISSQQYRMVLWAELAITLFLAERLEDCRRLVSERLRPTLALVKEDNPAAYRDLLMSGCAVALFASQKSSALLEIDALELPYRDDIYWEILNFLSKRRLPYEPLSRHPSTPLDLSYEEMCDMLDVTEHISTDNIMTQAIKWLSESISSKKGRDRLTHQHVQELARRIDLIISSKLPDPHGIQHDGYRLAALAHLYRIRKEPIERWNGLINQAETIPNSADRALLLALIAPAVGSRNVDRAKDVIKQSESLAKTLPSILDQNRVYRALALAASSLDFGTYRAFLKLSLFAAVNDPNARTRAQKVVAAIDFAHTIDSEFANSLASLLDDDSARLTERKAAKERLRLEELRKCLQTNDRPHIGHDDLDKLPEVAWDLLGMLNAKRSNPLKMERISDLMSDASRLHLASSYQVYAWLIQNLVAGSSRSDDANSLLLRSMLDAVLVTANLALRVGARVDESAQIQQAPTSDETSGGSFLARSGDRTGALGVLRNWVEQSAEGYIKICDPFFGPLDLESLKGVIENVSCRIEILTSRKHHGEGKYPEPWADFYRSRWRKMSSDSPSPDIEIVIAGLAGGGELPIHDRWWLSSSSGIRVGTSFGSLGGNRDSEISLLSRSDAKNLEQEINQYLYRLKREHRGRRVIYEIFSLTE